MMQWLDQLKEAIYDSEDLAAHVHVLFSPFDKAAMKSRLFEILDILGFIMEQKGFIGLREGVSPSHSSRLVWKELDREAVVEMVLSMSEEPGVSVLSIVGMGGIEKTTVAKLIYDDPRAEEWFGTRAWVGVSDKLEEVYDRSPRHLERKLCALGCSDESFWSVACGSKVVVMTRSEIVASKVSTGPTTIAWE